MDPSAWTLRWGLLSTSCGALLAGYFATGWLWGRIVHDLGGPDLPDAERIRLFMVANLGRYVPGKIWQMAGLVALARGRDVSTVTATAAAVLGQGIGLLAASLVGLGSVWIVADGAGWRWLLPVGIVAVASLGLSPPVLRAITTTGFRLVGAEHPDTVTPGRAAVWGGVAIVTWLVYAGAFWIFVEGLGIDAALLPTASAFAAAYVLGYVMIFAPAGLGVREGFLVALLSPQLGAATAGAVAILARLWTTVVEVVPAAAFWGRHLARSHGGGDSRE